MSCAAIAFSGSVMPIILVVLPKSNQAVGTKHKIIIDCVLTIPNPCKQVILYHDTLLDGIPTYCAIGNCNKLLFLSSLDDSRILEQGRFSISSVNPMYVASQCVCSISPLITLCIESVERGRLGSMESRESMDHEERE